MERTSLPVEHKLLLFANSLRAARAFGNAAPASPGRKRLENEMLTGMCYTVAMASPSTDPMPFSRDALTGLLGPDQARARLDDWLKQARDRGERAPIHALLLGLRRFDTVNLAYGEQAGDSALVEVAARILRFADDEFERDWIAARLGGGHFFLALNEPCSRERWEWLASALAAGIARPIGNMGEFVNVRLSPRVALVRAMPEDDGKRLFDRLARTLVRLDGQPGQRILWSDGESTLGGRSSAQLEADLLNALDRDEIEIVYQPQFAVADDRLIGAEALARWKHPSIGRIGAAALFAIAERADHVAQLSRHIANRALAEAACWPEALRLSLNVTAADLAGPSFAEDIVSTIQDTGFPRDRLTLEIVEQSLVSDLDRSAASLHRLVDRGVRVALDDFGAGFCNFRYLKILPIHYLKLDRGMVDEILHDPRDLAVFRAIVAMARALDLQVLAEGIEHEEQRALIEREGCDYYQGFLRARPMTAPEFQSWAKERMAASGNRPAAAAT